MKNVLFSLGVLFLVSTLTVAQDVKEFDAGIAKFRAKDYTGVIDDFSSILAKAEHNKRLDEDLYFYRGQSYYHTNEYDKALDDLEQSDMLNHFNTGVIYWYQARCYDKLGKAAEAESKYKKAGDGCGKQ
jgi:tetratricopeptide (TPR) repeat protein